MAAKDVTTRPFYANGDNYHRRRNERFLAGQNSGYQYRDSQRSGYAMRHAGNDTELRPDPMNAINLGDVVRLRSGGIMMTVTTITEENPNAAICVWFYEGSYRSGRFDLHTLKHADE